MSLWARRGRALAILCALCVKSRTSLAAPDDLPFGVYPSIDEVQDNPRPVQSLGTEIQDLTGRVQDTLKGFAERRNWTCFGGSCLVQAFPLLYTKPDSGFFGGVRANISKPRPNEDLPSFSADAQIIRSDTAQWLTFFAVDIPRIEALPTTPRLRMRALYSRTTETRYFGIGPSSAEFVKHSDEEVRYGLQEYGFQAALIVPVWKIATQKISIFGSFSTLQHKPAPFHPVSKLFDDRPLGIQGGYSSRAGMGLFLDSRDREILSRHGWMVEASGEVAGNPLGGFRFQRLSLSDRRYFSHGAFTLANRFTLDSVLGAPPFWELAGVGGLEPIRNVAGSPLLRGYRAGRFHERTKVINSSEFRWQLSRRRLLGQVTDVALVPLGANLGRLGAQNALSLSTGVSALFNRNFMLAVFLARSVDGTTFTLDFDKTF